MSLPTCHVQLFYHVVSLHPGGLVGFSELVRKHRNMLGECRFEPFPLPHARLPSAWVDRDSQANNIAIQRLPCYRKLMLMLIKVFEINMT